MSDDLISRRAAIDALMQLPSSQPDVPDTNVGDMISRQAAIDVTANATFRVAISGKRGFQNYKEEFEKACVAIRDKYIEALKALPAVQKERKKGKWKIAYLDHEAMGERPSIFYCSVCNHCVVYPLHFCPNCGAEMWG